MPAKKKTSVFMKKMFDLTRRVFENLEGGWQAGEVKKNCNNADKKKSK